MTKNLTIQQLANLCMFGWEVEREFGFHMEPTAFKEFVATMQLAQLRTVLESLSELLRTVREIGYAEVALQATGEHPFLAKLGGFLTPTAAAAGVEERLVVPPEDAAPSL
jgi:hypothetical protein